MFDNDFFNTLSAKLQGNWQQIYTSLNASRKAAYEADCALLNQQSDLKNSSGRVVRNIAGVDYQCLYIKKPGDHLYVLFNGAKTRQHDYRKHPGFPRWSYYPLFDGSLLVFDDPMLGKYPDLKLGWYYGDDGRFHIHDCVTIVKEVCEANAIPQSNVIFFSSSGGGYAALAAASCMPGTLSIAINPQINILKASQYIGNFVKTTGIQPLLDDKWSRANLAPLIRNSDSKHVILVNAASQADVCEQLLPFMAGDGIELRYGLTQIGNVLIWLYDAQGAPDADGVPNPHASCETKAILGGVLQIGEKFKNDSDFKADEWQPVVLLINESWHEAFQLRAAEAELMAYKRKITIFPMPPTTGGYTHCANYEKSAIDIVNKEANFIKLPYIEVEQKIFTNISIKPEKNDFHFYSYSDFLPESIYTIVIPDTKSSNVKRFTYGIFDFKSYRAVKYLQEEIGKSIKLTFMTDKNCEGYSFCIYAGICGNTNMMQLDIPIMHIYRGVLEDRVFI